jgi:hypothetical protein
MTRRRLFVGIGTVTVVVAFNAPARAVDVPLFMTEQGRLFDANSNPVAGTPLYLGITVGTDNEMTPRQPLSTVPYAFVASNAIGDITPNSVTINGVQVINADGGWVGPSSGLVGPTGPAGPAGSAGSSGNTGATGATGPAGAAGATGAAGLQGPTGATGAPGGHGIQGIQGPAGPSGVTSVSTLCSMGAESAGVTYATGGFTDVIGVCPTGFPYAISGSCVNTGEGVAINETELSGGDYYCFFQSSTGTGTAYATAYCCK